MAAESDPFLMSAVVFLGSAVVAVPIVKRLKLGSVLGYLGAGAVIGPFGLRLIQEPETVLRIAEFGVVLLLFVIGLELKPARLWRLRSDIFGLGLLQVLVTGANLAAFLILTGFRTETAIVAGAALALSSTAFAVQILREKKTLASPYGDRAFSILLFQDLAVVPLLALTSFLGPGATGEGMELTDAAIAVGALAALGVALRFGLPPAFNFIARTRTSEIFTAAALLVVTGSALIMEAVGLSMALGAFLAGLLLAESEFRHQLESDIEPFRGLLLGLFFMGFGMTLDWELIASRWWQVIGGAVGLFALKAAILFALSRLFGSDNRDAVRIAATVGQGGEFAFVLVSLSAATGLMTGELSTTLSAIVTLSMVLTPLAVALADRWPVPEETIAGMAHASEARPARVIIAGFGRVGQVIARVLSLRGYSITLIDNSPRRIRMAKQFGNDVYYGDATRVDVLASAGAEEADIIFLCIDDRDGARAAVEKLRERFPDAKIFADTYDRFSEIEMWAAGADYVVRETRESAIALARAALVALGDDEVAEEVIEEYRRNDSERMRAQGKEKSERALEKIRRAYEVEIGRR
ncbi:MAG TPA: monovalent cation:proton antiporter-2 (CPA2) family protein [Paracoccaceae bacterium]|nr:monovalent cation:proton antiporter-2 (CPA2) family protein [Paracoccaceae bacterium]